MLKLTDLIRLSGIELGDFKIHCATRSESSPLDAFFAGKWKSWQEHQNQRNFECQQILSLIYLGNARWLFAGLFEVLGVSSGNSANPKGYMYSTREIEGLDHLTGRVVVEFNKTFRQSYLLGPKYEADLIVSAIREQRLTVGEFPGFNSVLLSFSTLQTIVREAEPTWRAALKNVSGIYVITDNESGKHYIGSAYGQIGLWQRWCQYAESGHGGNKELKQLLVEKGAEHARHLQFSILEVCDLNTGDAEIIQRESHWKDVLRTREFGLNRN
jgi:hypothetical protein